MLIALVVFVAAIVLAWQANVPPGVRTPEQGPPK